jgi:hypothetical protein
MNLEQNFNMPVKKFKTFEEAQRELWNFNPGPDYYKSVSDLFNLMEKLQKRHCEKGVHKFKTFEMANKHRLQGLSSGT